MLEAKLEKLISEYKKADHIENKMVTLQMDFNELAYVYASVKGHSTSCKAMEDALIQACNAE